jgi:hypothetical protein
MSLSAPSSATGIHRAYVNGKLVVSANGIVPSVATSQNFIGKPPPGWDGGGEGYFLGNIDSLGFYPWAFNPSEVQIIMGSTGVVVRDLNLQQFQTAYIYLSRQQKAYFLNMLLSFCSTTACGMQYKLE